MSDRLFKRAGACARAFCLVAAGGVGLATQAWAGAGIVTTSVAPMAPNVSYATTGSNPLVTYIGYTVTIGSDPTNTNTINNVVFTGTASATDSAEKPIFSSADGATCTTTNTDKTAISCSIGQLRAGQTYPTFAIFFKAPAKATNGVADGANEDSALFSGITYYAEGTGGVPQSPPTNSTVNWSAAGVVLGTPSPVNVKSSVPKAGGNFFTGNGVSTAGDPFATTVAVPAAPTYTAEASIDEATFTTVVSGGPSPTTLTCVNFTPCYQSAVTVPGSFEYLQIILRQDASTINSGVKIGSVSIWYDGSDTLSDSYHGYLGQCPSPTTPLSDRPCIASSKYYKNKSVPGWTADLDGDFEWTIITKKNGGFKVGV
ncbi:MAG: hypothetical protein U0P30_18805 [Vicinamibacterales bacterium]